MIYIKRLLWVILCIIGIPVYLLLFILASVITPISSVIEFIVKGTNDYLVLYEFVDRSEHIIVNKIKPYILNNKYDHK